MTRLAVDVVLLPDPAVADLAVAVNRCLVDRFGSEILLDAESCLPHVSLAMGCMDPMDGDAAGAALRRIAEAMPPVTLTVIGTAVLVSEKGRKTSSLLIDKTEPLQRMHEQLILDLQPLLTHAPTESMFHGGGPISASTLAWVRGFPAQSSLARFWPHITLGYGEAPPIDRSFSFVASALALCHLGNHCTCRRVLDTAPLRGPCPAGDRSI